MAKRREDATHGAFLIDAENDPRLILGWRPAAQKLTSARVPLRDDVFDALRAVPTAVLARLESSYERTYEPTAELEEGEQHFRIPLEAVPKPYVTRSSRTRPPAREQLSRVEESLPDVAGLIDAIRTADEQEPLDARRLAGGSFLFYAIVIPGPDGNVGFVKKTDPVSVLRKGLAFFQFSDALVAAAKPDLMLYPDVDLIVGPESIVAFRKSALDQLLSDVKMVLQDVPSKAADVRAALTSKVPLTADAEAAIKSYCSTRPSLAARLRVLSARIDQIAFTPKLVRDSLRRHGADPKLLVNAKGEFDFGEDEVRAFLDVAEGRWFEDEFTGERRRADRFSVRR